MKDGLDAMQCALDGEWLRGAIRRLIFEQRRRGEGMSARESTQV
jgi:hypothetical protein